MTIHRSTPISASTAMPGDLIRIVVVGSSVAPLLGAVSRRLVKDAFGVVAIDGDGSKYLKLHDKMPSEVRGLERFTLPSDTQIERISMDSENEVALLVVDYLRTIGDTARSLATPGGEGATARAVLGADGPRLAEMIQSGGFSLVEVVTRKVITERHVYVTSNPELIQQGEIPADTRMFEYKPTATRETEVNIKDVNHIIELLTEDVAVKESVPTPPALVAQEVAIGDANLTPFMRSLLTPLGGADNLTLSASDLNSADLDLDQDDNTPGMR